jgi:DNA-binding transcriptional LysR family regulator
MSLNVPSIQALAAFESAARNGSFTKAAEELCITHGAVSHRVKLLEAQLDVTLFHRGVSGVTLTDSGERFLAATSGPLQALRDACSECRLPQRQTLKLSVSPAFGECWLLSRLGEFRALHPNVEVNIHASYDLADFKSDGVDAAIRYGRGDWAGVVSVEILKDRVFPACSREYAERAGVGSNPKDLRKATLLRFRREPWKPWFEAAGLDWDEPQEGPQFNDYNLLLQAAILSHGVLLARSAIASSALSTHRLVRLSEIAIPSQHSYFFVCPPQNLRRPAVDLFFSWVRGVASCCD